MILVAITSVEIIIFCTKYQNENSTMTRRNLIFEEFFSYSAERTLVPANLCVLVKIHLYIIVLANFVLFNSNNCLLPFEL